MRLIVFGDIHDHQERLTSTLELLTGESADLVVLSGDVGCNPPWSRRLRKTERQAHDDSVRRVIDRVGSALGGPVVFVPGNHDLPDPPADSGGVNLDGQVVSIAGLRLAGLGGAGPARFGFPYEWGEDTAEAALAATTADVAAGSLDILLSHTPPAATPLDRIHRGTHVGSTAVGAAIERKRPRLFVCGHIHEAWGLEEMHQVPCLNAGALGEPFGQALAWCVDWQDGPRRVESVRLDGRGEVERRAWPV